MIIHKPIFNVPEIEKYYSEKDGIPVKYVCTSATNEYDAFARDIFYRENPHPEFGNRYFSLFHCRDGSTMIGNADLIETLDFPMIEDSNGDLHYSAHRHDYKVVEDKMIDGGRAYVRTNGCVVIQHKMKDGEFVSPAYTPDGWVLVRNTGEGSRYQIFGSWCGRYMDSEAWHLNSGITKMGRKGSIIEFHVGSDSVYHVHESSYGRLSVKNAFILHNYEEGSNGDLVVLDEMPDIDTLEW